jgi:hypothetical protein
MSNYIFLTENYNEGPTTYYAIPADKIETMNESDTYVKFGVLVSSSDAGDSLSLSSQKGVEVANKLANKYEQNEESPADYEVGSIISAFEDSGLYDDILASYKGGELTDTDIDITRAKVSGFTFWDGHNWQTTTVRKDYGEPTHDVVSDEKLVAELNEAIENKSFEKSGFGCEVYSHENWVVIDSNWQGTWAAFEIMSVQDYEHMQPNSSALPQIH